MPLIASKLYVLNKIKKDKNNDESVLFHPLTNEICENVEELNRKTFLFNQKIWTCRITGQINLTFKEAQKSEQGCAKMLKTSFKKCYESTVLHYVHQSKDNLESIIHKAWTQLHEEYCVNEPVMIKLTTPKQLLLKGVVVKIDRSIKLQDDISPAKITSDASSSDKENIKKKTIPVKKSYHYSVKLFEMDKLVNDIPAETIERTFRPPSKDQIRMFIRAHALRHYGKPASNPWIVDEDIMKKYKLPNVDPEFVTDKNKLKEMSHNAEIQMYNKLIDDVQKKNEGMTVDLTASDDEDDKKRRKSVESNSSKKMKQMTLHEMHSAATAVSSSTNTTTVTKPKIKSPFASPTRQMPPLAQQLLRLMKDNKNDQMVHQLVIKCCQYTDLQIARFPELIRVPIKEKKEKLELKKKLRSMTQEERDVFMAERRVELRQLLKEKKKEVVKVDDAEMEHKESIVEGLPLKVEKGMSHDQWARLMSLSEFVRSFKGLLGPATTAATGDSEDLMVEDFCRAVSGEEDSDHGLLSDIVCVFLKPLLQDGKMRGRKEMGVSLGEVPVTACTAAELLKLMLPMADMKEEDEEEKETVEANEENEMFSHNNSTGVNAVSNVKHKGEIFAHNNLVAVPICDKLAQCEINCLSLEEKISVLELLQGRILELDIISNYIDDCQREATEAYKKRQVDLKDINDKLKVVRQSMSEMYKLRVSGDDKQGTIAEIVEDDSLPLSARRRLSLELKNKEVEEREKKLELERQYQRLEKEEAGYKRQAEQAHQAYHWAINEAKQLMRVQSLGSDRHNRRYWQFRSAGEDGAVYVETEVGGDGEVCSTRWSVLGSVAEVRLLMECLDERGLRESLLKKELAGVVAKMAEGPPRAGGGDSRKKPVVVPEEGGETFLVRGFKEELHETELNIRQGSLGGVEAFPEWETRLKAAGTLSQLKECLAAVFLGVHERFWNPPLKSASGRNDYLTAVEEAKTVSRLNVLQCLLDVCVCWSKSASDDKCRVCKKSHEEGRMLLCDGCNRAYHTFCLRPPLKRVPEGEWLCPSCKPTTDTKVSAAKDKDENEENVGSGEEEVCCVCQTGDEGLGRCVSCGSLYHAQCHEPPLRHMRRTNWYCGNCRVEESTASRSRHHNNHYEEEEEAGEDEEEEEVEEPVVAVAVKNSKRKSSVKSRKIKRGRKKEESDVEEEEDEEEEEEAVSTKKIINNKKRNNTIVNGGMKKKQKMVTEDEEEEEEEEVVLPKKRRNGVKRKPQEEEEEEEDCIKEDESDQDVENLQSLLTTSRQGRKRTSLITARSATSPSVKRRKTTVEPQKTDSVSKAVRTILRQLSSHKASWPFQEPVDEKEVPDYYTIVTRPMDIGTMMSRLKEGEYSGESGLQVFLEDVSQMFTNADLYNEAESKVSKLASELEEYFVGLFKKSDLSKTTISAKGDCSDGNVTYERSIVVKRTKQ